MNHKYDVFQFLKDNEGMWFTTSQICGATDLNQPTVNKSLRILLKWESGIEVKDVVLKLKHERTVKDGIDYYSNVRCKMYRYKGE